MARYRYSGANWNPAKHPRGRDGKFVHTLSGSLTPKFSQSVRLSPSSVSYNAGVRLQIVPGRANVYLGGLARVERVNGGNLFKRQTDNAVNAVARRLGDEGGKSNVAQVLKGNPISIKGTGAQASLRRGNPTFRLSRTPTTRAADQVSVRTRSPRVRGNRRAPILEVRGGPESPRTLKALNVKQVRAGDLSGRKTRKRKARRR